MNDELAKKKKIHLLLYSVRSNPNLRRWGLVSVSTMLLLSGLTIGLTYHPGQVTHANDNSAVNILPVKTSPAQSVKFYKVSQTYVGEIAAQKASELGFERSGELVWVNADRGDRVTVGTAIAKLDTRNLEAKRLELLAQKDQAMAVLEELKTGPRSENIAASRSSVKDLEEQLKLERIRRSRREHLYAEGVISKEQLDEVAFNANALSERLKTAQSNLDELLTGTRSEQIEAQQAAVRQIEASIADIEITIEKSIIKAPFSGTIAARRLDEGTVVDAGQPVVRLVEDTELEVEIGIPLLPASRLKLGSQQRVKIGQKTYQAKVSSILPEVDPATRTRTIVMTLEPSAAQLVVPKQIVQLEIIQTIPTAGYWLPTKAMVRGERGLWSCYALVEQKNLQENSTSSNVSATKLYQVEQRDVEVIHAEGDRVLVRGTIQSGDSIIVSGTQRIVNGQLVSRSEI